MKEVTAVVRRDEGRETLDALDDAGFAAAATKALGKGREKGLQYPGGSGSLRFLPKTLVTLMVRDDEAEAAVRAIVDANRTGEVGDGKVFVTPVEEAP